MARRRYGSDAVAGVVNFFLIHKFRGLEIGGSYGNTNMGASNDMGEWEAWLKAGTLEMTRPILWSLPISGSNRRTLQCRPVHFQ